MFERQRVFHYGYPNKTNQFTSHSKGLKSQLKTLKRIIPRAITIAMISHHIKWIKKYLGEDKAFEIITCVLPIFCTYVKTMTFCFYSEGMLFDKTSSIHKED